MLIERADSKGISIKFSNELSNFNLQRLMEYARFLEITSRSRATQKEIDILSNSVSSNWWKTNRTRFTTKSDNEYAKK
jgi:hypothetical protein